MEAPKKLYLHPTASGNVGASWLSFPLTDNDIEYIRTDAFIEKACEFIEYSITGYIDVTHKGGDENVTLQHEFIEELINYIKENSYDARR